MKDDMVNLKRKVDYGVDFLITQLFFENKLYFDFIDRASSIGINCPVIPGVMPVLKAEQIKSIAVKSGCSIPARLVIMMDKYQHCPEDLQKAGIEYAALQIKELADNGAPGVHIYTMNKPEPTRQILEYADLLNIK
jgi:methylenetetrahydrofolate reductase (NADPH)